ncbi:unnamed protein product [Prorocentrum cordatum]|uniref:Uncharacterized protein n=1 Tax=Prorocentrum cordatum TaxID=2364126 RepID=A0ABN9SR98_9DINO|nr:unnamed protein product [Polarella glacialis]
MLLRPKSGRMSVQALLSRSVGDICCRGRGCRASRSWRYSRHLGSARRCGHGEQPTEGVDLSEELRGAGSAQDDISERVNYAVLDNQKGIITQLQQYGYCLIDGFLGGKIHGHPDRIRDELKKLFDRGWFSEESEEASGFKVGSYRIRYDDRDNRYKTELFSAAPSRKFDGSSEAKEKAVETQYEVAPGVVKFARSLLTCLADPVARAAGGAMSTKIAIGEVNALCGQGARIDRRVHNVYGWNTQQGFSRDPRKLTIFYFANPKWRPELGGNLQLEGVISPTGQVSLDPQHDRLVMFWSDKTVWSIAPTQELQPLFRTGMKNKNTFFASPLKASRAQAERAAEIQKKVDDLQTEANTITCDVDALRQALEQLYQETEADNEAGMSDVPIVPHAIAVALDRGLGVGPNADPQETPQVNQAQLAATQPKAGNYNQQEVTPGHTSSSCLPPPNPSPALARQLTQAQSLQSAAQALAVHASPKRETRGEIRSTDEVAIETADGQLQPFPPPPGAQRSFPGDEQSL